MQLESLTTIAAIACLLGVGAEFWRVVGNPSANPAFIRSPLFLPLYAGGILQWLLFGFATANLAITITCGLQLLLLVPLLRRHWRYHRR